MINITLESATQGLRALAEEMGEGFVYPRNIEAGANCVYVHEGKPDCIVGRFLAGVGVPVERLKEADKGTFSLAAGTLLRELRQEGVIEFEHNALRLLSRTQISQDEGIPWGDAVADALRLGFLD